MQGRVIDAEGGNIHLDLALEHAILHEHDKNIYGGTIRFWITPRAVILGRSQNIEHEVDIPYCKREKIVIARRISGGGAVFTDQGNLNISIFLKKDLLTEKKFNYQNIAELFSNFLIEALSSQYSKGSFKILNSSSVLFQNRKISGSAGYIHKEWVLHHLTLLHATNLTDLNSSLKAGKPDYTSRRPSNFYPTTNIPFLSIDQFKLDFISVITTHFNINFTYNSILEQEKSLAQLLADRMYSQNVWVVHKKRILLENSFRKNNV